MVYSCDFFCWQIRIDGQDIRGVTLESLRKHLGVVPQDTVSLLIYICQCCSFQTIEECGHLHFFKFCCIIWLLLTIICEHLLIIFFTFKQLVQYSNLVREKHSKATLLEFWIVDLFSTREMQ